MDHVVLSAKDLQKMGFSRTMAYRLLNRADLPVLSIGERKFMNKALFLDWLNSNSGKLEDHAETDTQK